MAKTKKPENNSDSPINRRRFPRINIRQELEKAKALIGASVDWLEDETSQMFDISYLGAAIERPKKFKAQSGDVISLQMKLGDFEPIQVEGLVVWFNDRLVGVEFQNMDHVSRSRIDEFLEDKIVGSHMIPVSPNYFSDHVDFQHWFHGPNNTNVFLWEPKGKRISRAMISFDGQAMIFEEGEFHRAGGEMDWDVQATYSAESLPKKETDELLVILEKDSPLVDRSIEILAQLQEFHEPIKELLTVILEARS